ncbi:MAG: aldolase/citrate lyase family protein [Armatimonadetes bacterium]|nr:aldolase/citrate lyase family protein [Armatimonadota bacterium]
MQPNRVLRKLREGQPALLGAVWTVPHWKIVEMLGIVGYDGVWIEMEHSDTTWEQMSQMILAARATGMEAIVRIPRGSYSNVLRPLEAGATGLLLPHCTGSDDAYEFVRMARFAPIGWRGIGGSVDTRYGSLPLQEYFDWANREILLGVMIERKEAVQDVEAIARVEGLDLLLVGPADLSQSLGVRGEIGHPLLREAVERVADACLRHGKYWAVAGQVPSYAEQMAMGARFFAIVDEMSVLIEGFQRAKALFEAE